MEVDHVARHPVLAWFTERKGNNVRLRVESLDERAVPACVDFFSTTDVSPIVSVGTAPSDPALKYDPLGPRVSSVNAVGPETAIVGTIDTQAGVSTYYDALIQKVIAGPQPEPPLL